MKRLLRSFLLLAPLSGLAAGGSVVGSKHDLSAGGPGPIKSRSETEVCVFCHIPHGSGEHGNARPDPTARYELYASSTLAAEVPGAPDGATRICLSCHDGTIAVGQTRRRRIAVERLTSDGRLPPGHAANLGTDLRRTHPVSIRPPRTSKIRPLPATDAVHLDRGGKVQCTSCHDPHRESPDGVERKFLVKSNRSSAICASCHEVPYWASNPSSHQLSRAVYTEAQGAATSYGTVAENGCAACHDSHRGGVGTPLVRRNGAASDDQVCLGCHDGRVAKTDLVRQAGKPFAHAAPPGSASSHDAGESPTSGSHRLPETQPLARRHVTCVDCHNPHAAFKQDASAPRASGALSGVWGIDRNGLRVEPVQFQYEICFKCHGDSANQPQARGSTPPETLRRAFTDVNLRRQLDPAAPSFHPIVAPGRNQTIPGLKAPLMPSSVIFCTDCHASDAAAAENVPRGPHGSRYAHLLEREYQTADRTPESPAAYALCYKCHDRDVLLSDPSGFPHRKHVVDQATPCSACHASHGVSAFAGNAVNNAHLVDFDVSIVRPSQTGLRLYKSTTRSCTLSCHGSDHVDKTYGPGVATTQLKLRQMLRIRR